MNNFDAKKVKNEIVQWIKDWFNENGKGCCAVVGISGGKRFFCCSRIMC